NPLILHIEDDPFIHTLVRHVLTKNGYNVEYREDGKDGLEAIKILKPDVVILDVMLPGLNGLEVLQEIRTDKEIQNTKVIMLTSNQQVSDLEIAFKLAADDYMNKPFNPAELELRIKKLLN
ncbi:MAG: response regulator transcription factor, partial [Candidatus Halalkalibacterium sp. M3_1C_030]